MQTTFYNEKQLHHSFVKACKKSNKSLSEVLRELMKLYTEQGETLLKAKKS